MTNYSINESTVKASQVKTCDESRISFLSDESPNDKDWDKGKSLSNHLSGIFTQYTDDKVLNKHGDRMKDCADFLWFTRMVDTSTGELRLKLKQVHFCHVRTCPNCQKRRSLISKVRLMEALPKIRASLKFSTDFLFLTLTVKNCAITDLRATIKHMNESWHRMAVHFRDYCPWILGWVVATETTRGKDGSAHPHFHVLLMVKSTYFKKSEQYMSHADWMALWKRSAKLDYDPSVHIQRAKAHKDKDADLSAVCETIKYSTKVDEELLTNDPDWICEYAKQIHRLQLLRTGGVLAGVLKEDYTNEEMLETLESEDTWQELDERVGFAWWVTFARYGRRKTPEELRAMAEAKRARLARNLPLLS